MKKISTTFKKLIKSKRFLWIGGAVVVLVGGYFLFHKSPTYQFIPVTRGSITESISLTGNTTPAQSVSLAFGSSGTISHTYADLGKHVYAGQVLAELNTSDLAAQLRQAQANVDIQQARLEGLQNGSRPEDVASSQAAVDKANQDLANMYSSISDTSVDSYAKANDAVRTQLSAMFTNGDTNSAHLTYTTSSSQAEISADTARYAAGTALDAWHTKLSATDQSNDQLEAFLKDQIGYLSSIRTLLNNVSSTLDTAPGMNATTLATYKANISAALTEVNTAAKNLNTISENIASQKLSVSQLQAQLNLKKAGSLPTDISAQQAQVEQAQASVDSARAKLQNAEIIAPISGVVTVFDAKIGQLASPSAPLVSIMSSSGYEVDAGVSETDVGKITMGNTVTMTLDAFPGETFNGSVFYIAPAETNNQGVISYQVKISFAKSDARLKSGLTANIDIETKHKDNVLVLPEYAILQNDNGTFVETLEGKTTKQNPITLGISDQKGNVEVLTGVTEGEQVLNIGLKQ